MRMVRVALLGFAAAVATAASVVFLACVSLSPAADPTTGAEPPEPADNSYCLVCHLNYETEKLTDRHATAGVGCANCHGESAKHSGDEDGLTPPDVMFDKADVDKLCMTCHPKDKVIEADKRRKSDYHKEVFDSTGEDHLVCSECHAENHRMEVRTRIWDRKTRKLISDDGVRMMYKDSPATEGVRPTQKNP